MRSLTFLLLLGVVVPTLATEPIQRFDSQQASGKDGGKYAESVNSQTLIVTGEFLLQGKSAKCVIQTKTDNSKLSKVYQVAFADPSLEKAFVDECNNAAKSKTHFLASLYVKADFCEEVTREVTDKDMEAAAKKLGLKVSNGASSSGGPVGGFNAGILNRQGGGFNMDAIRNIEITQEAEREVKKHPLKVYSKRSFADATDKFNGESLNIELMSKRSTEAIANKAEADNRSAQSLLAVAEMLKNQNRTAVAIDRLQVVLDKYPGTAAAAAAAKLIEKWKE